MRLVGARVSEEDQSQPIQRIRQARAVPPWQLNARLARTRGCLSEKCYRIIPAWLLNHHFEGELTSILDMQPAAWHLDSDLRSGARKSMSSHSVF
jgi:hypothetical protein